MPTFIVVKPTTDVNKAFDLGWAHGVNDATNAHYGYSAPEWKAYPTEAEQEAYNLGRRNGFNSI